MDEQLPMALQVALYVMSGAIVVLAAAFVYVLLRFDEQLGRMATAAEKLEAELTPLTRELRVVVDRVGNLSERARRQWVAWEELSAAVLSPVLAFNRTTRILRTGAVAFLRALWNRHRPAHPMAASTSSTDTVAKVVAWECAPDERRTGRDRRAIPTR